MRSTARSESASAPTSLASNSRPSTSVTLMRLPRRMTCALVRIVPSASTMTPEPRLVRVGAARPRVEEVAEELVEERIGRPGTASAARPPRSVEMFTTAGLARSTASTTWLRRSGSVSGARGPRGAGDGEQGQDRERRPRHRGRVSSRVRPGRSRSGGARPRRRRHARGRDRRRGTCAASAGRAGGGASRRARRRRRRALRTCTRPSTKTSRSSTNMPNG